MQSPSIDFPADLSWDGVGREQAEASLSSVVEGLRRWPSSSWPYACWMASAGKSATRVAVLASGQGGTFQALVEAGRRGEMPAEVVLLIVRRRDVPAAELADRLGIERVVLDERLVGSAADFFADVFPV